MAASTISSLSVSPFLSGAQRKSGIASFRSLCVYRSEKSIKSVQIICAASSERGNWLPGSTPPSYLDGTLAGDNGFDPLALGERADDLRWYVQAELQNGRWAMLGVAGILLTDILRVSGVNSSLPPWYEAGAVKYEIADTPTLLAIQLILFGFVEGKRYMDYVSRGSQGTPDAFFFFIEDAFLGVADGYPGGPLFNPLGLVSRPDLPHPLKDNEIANGRLAMLAFLGFSVQHLVTEASPIENLITHLSDPWHNTVVSTIVSALS